MRGRQALYQLRPSTRPSVVCFLLAITVVTKTRCGTEEKVAGAGEHAFSKILSESGEGSTSDLENSAEENLTSPTHKGPSEQFGCVSKQKPGT